MIIGQDEVVRDVIISIFSRGHCLLVGVPGLAKTLLVSTVARALGLSFHRIQFTPDQMPSDIIGTEVLDENRQFRFINGPLFANIILADEINRTPPKSQSALLESMKEYAVTAAGKRYPLISLSSYSLGRTRSNRRGPIRSPKRNSTDSFSMRC